MLPSCMCYPAVLSAVGRVKASGGKRDRLDAEGAAMTVTTKEKGAIPGGVKVVLAAVMGAVGGLVGTAAVLGSFELGLFGAVAGAVFTAIAALAQVERAEREGA